MAPKRKHDAEDEDLTDWASLTVPKLKAELVQRGLPVSGKKAALIDRLNSDDRSDAAAAPAAANRQDWSSMTVAPLKAELSRRGLPVSGNKSKLVERLENDDEGDEGDDDTSRNAPAKKLKIPVAAQATATSSSGKIEKRLQPFVEAPGADYLKKLHKAQTERLFMLDRQKGADRDGVTCENFDIAGSKGSVYEVTIGRKPNCTCMDARIRGQKCKHIKYALIIVLKAPADLCYQDAFLSSELESIFANAPVTRAVELGHNHVDDGTMHVGKRKPIDGECPICVFDMEEGEELVWCKAACGQNFHKECFEQWRRSKQGGKVTCVYCRTEWQENVPNVPNGPPPGSLANLKNIAPKVGSYKNVAHLMPQYSKDYQDPQDYERYGGME